MQRITLVLMILVLVVGCYDLKKSQPIPVPEGSTETPSLPPPSTPPIEGSDPALPPVSENEPNPVEKDPTAHICTTLDFKSVTWPLDLTDFEHTYYALSLNITGSFEGHVGWKNIAGNFDGQGISLGLLQQNLGQGSLQPLLIEMYQSRLDVLESFFSPSKLSSMKGMLENWAGMSLLPGTGIASIEHLQTLSHFEELFPDQEAFNKLDQGYEEGQLEQQAGNSGQSVTWARSNVLDSRGNVLADWKKSFQSMAEHSSYRSLQLKASTRLFLRARAYFETFGFTELRFLLLMFDFVVQNGSIGSQHLDIYNNWLRQYPYASEEEKALALLEARLTTVKPEYKDDVRSRKTTLIKGQGVVHQTKRNLSSEYCFDLRAVVQ